MIKYSVIVPVYNSSKYINKCIDSLVNQTFKDIELIFVNDGSTDNSRDIIMEYSKKYKNIKLFNITNHGQAYARNYGFSKAKGKYISFIDSDDYVDVDLYKDIDVFMNNKDYDIVLFDYRAVSSDNEVLFDKAYDISDNNNVKDEEYLFADPCPWNKIYKKAFLDKVNFKMPEGMIYEDFCYIPTLVKGNPKIGYVNKSLYYYVYSDSSTMRNDEYKEKYGDLIKAANILYDSFKDTKYLEEICYISYYHILYSGCLNFYKYSKYDKINELVDFMRNKFPTWNKNKYVLERPKKERFLAWLFYNKKMSTIKVIQVIKKLVKHEN